MANRALSDDEIVEAACYLVLPYRRTEKTESMFQKIVAVAREHGLDLSPEFYAHQSDDYLRKLTIAAYLATAHYSHPKRWTGDDGVINKLKPLSYEGKLHVLFALHEFHCIGAERRTRNGGRDPVGGMA